MAGVLWSETLWRRHLRYYAEVIEGQGRLAALRFGGDGDELKRGGTAGQSRQDRRAAGAAGTPTNRAKARLHCRLAILKVNCASWRSRMADDSGSNESKV
ncbi:hypothetical protein ACLK19_16710 [Escherichia coli]